MLNELNYLFEKTPDYKITPFLSINHHTYKEIKEYGEEKYISEICKLLTTSHDYKSFFADQGLYYDCISDLEFFAILIKEYNDTFIFSTALNNYQLYQNNNTKELILYSPTLDDYITKEQYQLIREHLNSMIGYMHKDHKEFPKNNKIRELLIEEERTSLKLYKYKSESSESQVSIKDVIRNYLYNKHYENIKHNFSSYDDNYHTKELCESVFNVGKLDTIEYFADIIYKELQRK